MEHAPSDLEAMGLNLVRHRAFFSFDLPRSEFLEEVPFIGETPFFLKKHYCLIWEGELVHNLTLYTGPITTGPLILDLVAASTLTTCLLIYCCKLVHKFAHKGLL